MHLHLAAKITIDNYPLGSVPSQRPRGLFEDVLREVAERHQITLMVLRSTDKRRHTVIARQEAMWELRQRGHSFPRIGALLHRDHTTVLHGVRAHERRMAG